MANYRGGGIYINLLVEEMLRFHLKISLIIEERGEGGGGLCRVNL